MSQPGMFRFVYIHTNMPVRKQMIIFAGVFLFLAQVD